MERTYDVSSSPGRFLNGVQAALASSLENKCLDAVHVRPLFADSFSVLSIHCVVEDYVGAILGL